MQALSARFGSIVIIMAAVFGLVLLFYYFKFRRANVSQDDRSLWHLRLSTGFVGAVILVATSYLPSTGFYRDVDLAPSAREAAFEKMVSNQQRLGEQLDQMKDVLSVLFLMLGVYLLCVGGLLGRLWRARRLTALSNEPAVRKPLGLETD